MPFSANTASLDFRVHGRSLGSGDGLQMCQSDDRLAMDLRNLGIPFLGYSGMRLRSSLERCSHAPISAPPAGYFDCDSRQSRRRKPKRPAAHHRMFDPPCSSRFNSRDATPGSGKGRTTVTPPGGIRSGCRSFKVLTCCSRTPAPLGSIRRGAPCSMPPTAARRSCHTPWHADLMRKLRGPANQSPIIMWPYPIDPWPGEPLPDEYDLLLYAKNGHRPQLLEHLAEVFPRHIQIHDGRYQREQLFEAARRSRACAYLADDDHGPLALQEILLAGCPTVGSGPEPHSYGRAKREPSWTGCLPDVSVRNRTMTCGLWQS